MASEIGNALLYVGGFLLVAALSYLAILRILRPNKRTKLLLILPLSERNGDVTEELYAQHIRLGILGLRDQSRVIALDIGMNEKQRRDCIRFCQSVEDLDYCSAEDWQRLLEIVQKER